MSSEPSPPTRHRRQLLGWLPIGVIAFAAVLAPVMAPSGDTEAGTSGGTADESSTAGDETSVEETSGEETSGVSDEVLRAGAEVFSTICAQCHQAGGVGVAGQYPPLKDNPNVADAAYVEEVIRNGKTGQITVNGETYDGVMPPQSALSDDDIANVIAYIQSGFAAPSTPAPELDTGPVAGTDLPALADYAYIVAFLIAIGLGAMVLGPRIVAANDRRQLTWVDAWMKTAVIVVGLIVATTIVPAKVLETKTVEDLPRAAQDLIAVSIWVVALVASAVALWYAHREDRV